ncbi:unnamed protein product [Polarella glacialis]|uniref:Glutamine amidotransferase type-2 domain-containing protein n=1 Tax=Polarella glacialis TaxID=89957 RepID=A0A813JGM7_POLGL|nr:unnamed protein product [Polarella glacialis]
MGTFLMTSMLVLQMDVVNRFMQFRGDGIRQLEVEGLTFLQNVFFSELDSGHGAAGPPPAPPVGQNWTDGGGEWLRGAEAPGVLALFSGRIFNFRELGFPQASTEAEALLAAYVRYGPTFVRRLRGEFSLCIVDLPRKRYVLAVDAFGTRPLHYGRIADRVAPAAASVEAVARSPTDRPGFGVASYRSALASLLGTEAVRVVPPNSILVFDEHFELLERRTVFEFDLRQWKHTFIDWERAFEESVLLRSSGMPALSGQEVAKAAAQSAPFLGLSAGLDSGALHAALLKLGLDHVTYTVTGMEDMEVLRERVKAATIGGARRDAPAIRKQSSHKSSHLPTLLCRILQVNAEVLHHEKVWLNHNCEPNMMKEHFAGKVTQDPAALGISAICRDAVARGGHRIMLSAQGGDELFSDGGNRGVRPGGPLKSSHGRFFGLFPESLSGLFPWKRFFLGLQRDMLLKEVLTAGSQGVEVRFPLLDPQQMQEFLWLAAKLKNRHYKAPLHTYMASQGYPFVAPVPHDGSLSFEASTVTGLRRGYQASERRLLSRPVFAEFGRCEGGSRKGWFTKQLGSKLFERCWQRVEARAQAVDIQQKRHLHVINGCAQGRLEQLDLALARCSELGIFANVSSGCAEGHLHARRGSGQTCLGLLEANHPHLIGLVLAKAALAGLCSAATCHCHAKQRWGLSSNFRVFSQTSSPDFLACSSEQSTSQEGALRHQPLIDAECALHCAGVAPAIAGGSGLAILGGGRTDDIRQFAVVKPQVNHSTSCNLELQTARDRWTLQMVHAMNMDVAQVVHFTSRCASAPGRLAEVWLDPARYLQRVAEDESLLLGLRLAAQEVFRLASAFSSEFAGNRLSLSETHLLLCLPPSCAEVSPGQLRAAVWHFAAEPELAAWLGGLARSRHFRRGPAALPSEISVAFSGWPRFRNGWQVTQERLQQESIVRV